MVWGSQVDEDFAAAEFRLQYRRSGGGGGQYEEAFSGRDSEFLVLQLDPHTDYLFRVCARGEGRTEWSPWSIPQTGYTTLAPHGTWTPPRPRGSSQRCLTLRCFPRVAFRDRRLHPEQQEEHRSAQRLRPQPLPRPLLQRPHLLLRTDALLQVRPPRVRVLWLDRTCSSGLFAGS